MVGCPAHERYGGHIVPAITCVRSFIIDFNYLASEARG